MLEELLNSEGAKGVDLYRQSFIDGKRVATGKTNQSVAYEVNKTETSITLSIYGRKDINDLQDGVSASEYASNPATFSDLSEWINARGLNRTAESIDEGLRRNGWVSGDGPKGGTPMIIDTPSQQIISNIESKVSEASKDFVVKNITIDI